MGVAPRVCSVEGCEGKHSAKGYCAFHYDRHKRGFPMDAPRGGTRVKRGVPCLVDGCNLLAGRARGMCAGHYARWQRGQDMDAPLGTVHCKPRVAKAVPKGQRAVDALTQFHEKNAKLAAMDYTAKDIEIALREFGASTAKLGMAELVAEVGTRMEVFGATFLDAIAAVVETAAE